MAKHIFTLGPVLSFRGIKDNKSWGVTALIGVLKDNLPPKLQIEGRDCVAPVVLYESSKETFYRYDLTCEMLDHERKVEYGVVEEGLTWEFTIPGKGYAPRMAYVSCNGFSDASGMRKLVRPENAVWADLICNHDRNLRPQKNGQDIYLLDKEQLWHETRTHDKGLQRFHLMLMGGDQIYFDSIWEDVKSLKHWVGLSRKEQLAFKVSKTLDQEIERYYLGLYSHRWLPSRRRAWNSDTYNLDAADAMARIPTVMMWDDHDIFDGWGSYSDAMQNCELFKVMFRHARKAFWVFQTQHELKYLPELQYIDRYNVSHKDPQYQPINWEELKEKDQLALPFLNAQPGFNYGHHLGPVSLFVADLRSERSRTQVLGSNTWNAFHDWLNTINFGELKPTREKCQHLVFMSSVPVAHPKLSLAEGLLDTFGQDHVLDSNADDLKDHWSHDDHEGERKRLLETLTEAAERHKLRVCIVSGDVHVAAWGSAYRRDIPSTSNWAQIQQFTSSAVVHPSLVGVAERLFLFMLNSTASKVQSLDVQHSVEMMLFPGYNKYVMPARNWLALELDMGDGEQKGCKLWATWRCETESSFSNHLQVVQPAQ